MRLLPWLLHQFRIDLRVIRVAGIRWGHRPAGSHGAPLIGPAGLQGLHLATGTYRNGILMASAVAAITTKALQGSVPAGGPVWVGRSLNATDPASSGRCEPAAGPLTATRTGLTPAGDDELQTKTRPLDDHLPITGRIGCRTSPVSWVNVLV